MLVTHEVEADEKLARARSQLFLSLTLFVAGPCNALHTRRPTKLAAACDFADNAVRTNNENVYWDEFRTYVLFSVAASLAEDRDVEQLRKLSDVVVGFVEARSNLTRTYAPGVKARFEHQWPFLVVYAALVAVGVSLKCAKAAAEAKAEHLCEQVKKQRQPGSSELQDAG